jgi:hypothetical protein
VQGARNTRLTQGSAPSPKRLSALSFTGFDGARSKEAGLSLSLVTAIEPVKQVPADTSEPPDRRGELGVERSQ